MRSLFAFRLRQVELIFDTFHTLHEIKNNLRNLLKDNNNYKKGRNNQGINIDNDYKKVVEVSSDGSR